ncbi:MAG: hypothetical protein E7310_05775 [Clostridiales bacterium]|nr:hypothetical protein [Clostridiales bacterium]
MNYKDFELEMHNLIAENLNLRKQTNIMFIPRINKIMRENPIEREVRVRYNIDNVWDNFVYLENKILFYIDKYLNRFLEGLNRYGNIRNQSNIILPVNTILEEAIYYFDSFTIFFSTLIEPDQKNLLKKYLDSSILDSVFPNRNTISLYWQVYMLRNRIAHFTSNRYDNTNKECIQYYGFSSKIQSISINDVGEIHANSTLIDMYKCEQAQEVVKLAIDNKGINPFDLLFPNKSPKGYGKKSPFINFINSDIYFDYIDSGIKLIKDIHNLLGTINKLFLDAFMVGDIKPEETLNSRTVIVFYDKEIEYSIYDVFYNSMK